MTKETKKIHNPPAVPSSGGRRGGKKKREKKGAWEKGKGLSSSLFYNSRLDRGKKRKKERRGAKE